MVFYNVSLLLLLHSFLQYPKMIDCFSPLVSKERLQQPMRSNYLISQLTTRAITISVSSSKTDIQFKDDNPHSDDDMTVSNEASKATNTATDMDVQPQAMATGYSQNPDLILATEEATRQALAYLPTGANIDLGLVFVSSIYDGQYSPTVIVPTIVDTCQTENFSLSKLIGCSAGGIIGTKEQQPHDSAAADLHARRSQRSIQAVENEGGAGVVVTLCVFPDTKIRTFHLQEDDVPDDVSYMSPQEWKQSVGMSCLNQSPKAGDDMDASPSFLLFPAPSFQKDLDDFLKGMKMAFGDGVQSTLMGALSSTVSSLSRAKLFRYDVDEPNVIQTLTEGCIGVSMVGDAEMKVMVAQGAKPVGGVYRIVSGKDSTIGVIQLDEMATKQLEEDAPSNGIEGEELQEEEEEDDNEELEQQKMDAKKKLAAAYAKAAIPKPVLAEANYLMKTLSDDDQAFMRKFLLVGLERSGGMIGNSPSEIIRLAQGKGHRFTVHQVASAGMKDGSVTLPLGSVNVELGTRMRFFVRDGSFAKKEVEAIWTGYKKRELESTFAQDSKPFQPTGCLMFPTLDRGKKFFGGKSGYESSAVVEYVPNLPSLGGFFCNGIISRLDDADKQFMVHGSASCYVLFGSKSRRPVFCAAKAQEEKERAELLAKKQEEERQALAAENEKKLKYARDLSLGDDDDMPAPRSADGELIIKRREVHSGRALTISSVQWSVAEKMAKPTSALEGFMWDKETEVDRLRERVPLANLVSQCKLFDMDPSKPKPRDWIAPVRAAARQGFVIIPELKRTEPMTGSLRKRYDVKKLTKQFINAGATALSVNCDQVYFGGSLEDITESREAASEAILKASNAEEGVIAPPILASDLILYPYQLYKLRLAGADAVTLVVGALTTKDLLYFTKIAATLKMNVVASVTSEVQIDRLTKLGSRIDAISVSNRDLESFSFDDTGAQALNLLSSEAMRTFKQSHPDAVVLAEGRVGMIEMDNGMGDKFAHLYVEALKDAGAMGAIVGGGIANVNKDDVGEFLESFY
eukprot:CAMPEP_0176501240 /NCGR_PEP_ID=MMETSP0200_2-20121128/14050_1 /TAXON_ID=947934 /ORGANISM="Chaetoceros sp., Strain GSL56" /LENGTH=1026 /DNA_ID=CAMNT_0017900103 /DNA_START=71 /DNA_END=3151 /DNA_ORIENTATION=+